MKIISSRITISIFFILMISILFSVCTNNSVEKTSSLFKYSGYSEPEFKEFTKISRYIEIKDGTKLAIDIFIPAKGPEIKKFPVIFIFTPYGRSYLIKNLPWYKKIITWFTKGTSGPVFDYSTKEAVKYYLAHGYAFAVADMRGSGASFGTQIPFSQQLVDDGVEVINWIAKQPWSNGKLGMMGQSYLGWIQLMLASRKPAPLKCIMPEAILSDAYSEGIRPGGIDANAWIWRYSEFLNNLNLNKLDLNNMTIPTTPVTDEDKDGSLADEIPEMDKGNITTFLDDGPPQYEDKILRKNIYYNATKEHTDNILFSFSTGKRSLFINDRVPEIDKTFTFYTSSPGYYLKEIIKSGIPVYHVGGWFDGFIKGTTRMYATMQGQTNVKLQIAPRFHYSPFVTKPYRKLFNYEGEYKDQIMVERLRFFDRYLKGIKNGIDNEPPVQVYVMNKGWRAEKSWPLKRQKIKKFFFNSSHRLSTGKSTGGADKYTVDFSHSSSYGTNRKNRYLMMYVPDEIMDRTAADKKCLIYESAPLAQGTEITGHPVVNLWLSSSSPGGDFFVYITDVDRKGRSIYVSEGKLRAGWKKLSNDNDQVSGKFDIQPDLPWHGYKKKQFTKNVFSDGRAIKLRFDLMPTSWFFKKGHKIRIAVACADNNNFQMNPSICTSDKPESCRKTTVTIHRSLIHSSYVELPVIP